MSNSTNKTTSFQASIGLTTGIKRSLDSIDDHPSVDVSTSKSINPSLGNIHYADPQNKRPILVAGPSRINDHAQQLDGYLFKLLCPQLAVGSIIGKGGSLIAEIHRITGAKIKISQSNEFYPESNDRVISISGSLSALESAISEIVTRIVEVIYMLMIISCTHSIDISHPHIFYLLQLCCHYMSSICIIVCKFIQIGLSHHISTQATDRMTSLSNDQLNQHEQHGTSYHHSLNSGGKLQTFSQLPSDRSINLILYLSFT